MGERWGRLWEVVVRGTAFIASNVSPTGITVVAYVDLIMVALRGAGETSVEGRQRESATVLWRGRLRNAGIEGMEAVSSPTDPAVLNPEARENGASSLNRAHNNGNRNASSNTGEPCSALRQHARASNRGEGGKRSRSVGVQSGA